MSLDEYWPYEFQCECGAKFEVKVRAFSGPSGLSDIQLTCGFCKRQKVVLLPASEVKYKCVAPSSEEPKNQD